MKSRAPRVGQRTGPNDVGTLWTMRRLDYHARCALIAWPTDWELRIIVEGATLLSERCSRGAEAFRLAEQWRGRMVQQGWLHVTPERVRQSLQA